MYKRNAQGWTKHLDFILWDVVAQQIAYILAYLLRHGPSHLPYSLPLYRMMALVLVFLDVMVAVLFNTMHNVMKRGYYQELRQTVKQAILVLGFMSIYLFSYQVGGSYSRIVIYLTTLLHIGIAYITRLLWKIWIRRRGLNRQKYAMVLVADENVISEVISRVGPLDDKKVVGAVLADRDAEGETIQGIPIVANMDNAAAYICREWVDDVFIYSSFKLNTIGKMDEELDEKKGSVEQLIEQCQIMGVPVHLRLPIRDSNVNGKSFLEKMGGYAILTTTPNYMTSVQLLGKRLLDIVGGVVGSLIALIIMAIVGPKIKKASPGPILFKQERIGQNGKKFKMIKLRSMYMDAEERKKELMEQNRVADGMMFKLDFDPRIIGNEILPDGTRKTGIGEFIRSSSLDEFPQFFNVLKGEMSLVGTRPPTVDEWEKYEFHHRARLATKPGITGMWQANGRSSITDFEEVVKLDTEYINNWSMGLDIKILIKTVISVIKKDGAM